MRNVLLLLMLAAVVCAVSTTISYPADGMGVVGKNLSYTYVCDGASPAWTGSTWINGSFKWFNIDNNGVPRTVDLSGVYGTGDYNITVECRNGLDMENATARVAYFRMPDTNSTVSYTPITYAGFTGYISSFMDGYLGYVLSIFVMGISFLMTRNIQASLIAGSIGMMGIYFMTSTGIFLAGALLLLMIGFILKYAGG